MRIVFRLPAAASFWGRTALARLAPFLVAISVYLCAYVVMQPTTTGDEPHYLIFAHSLVVDGDLELQNNYDADTVTRYYPLSSLEPHALDYRGDGTLLPLHYIGLPLLIAPIVLFGGGVQAARMELILISAILAHQLFELLRDCKLGGPALVWPVWASLVLCVPLVAFSNQIYPEMPAALLVLYGVRVISTRRPPRWRLLLASLAVGALPWLHVRYSVFAAGIALGVAYRLLGSPASRQCLWLLLKKRPSPLVLWPLVPAGVSFALLPVAFYAWYGNPWPMAMYGPELEAEGSWSLSTLYRLGLGTMLSPSYGWLPFAPVHWLGIGGLIPLAATFRPGVPIICAFIGVYFLLVGGPIHAGTSFPARYLVVVIPLVGVPLLFVLRLCQPARVAFVPLLALSLAIAVVAVTDHVRFYPDPSGRATLPVADQLQEAWPNFAASDTFTLRPEFVTSRPHPLDVHFPSWPRSLLWVLGTMFVSALLIPHVRRRRQAPVVLALAAAASRSPAAGTSWRFALGSLLGGLIGLGTGLALPNVSAGWPTSVGVATAIPRSGVPATDLDYEADVETWWAGHWANAESPNYLAAITLPSPRLDVQEEYGGEIQAALDACPEAGCTLYLRNGTYAQRWDITGPNRNNIHFVGESRDGVLVRGGTIAGCELARRYTDWDAAIQRNDPVALECGRTTVGNFSFTDLTFDGGGDQIFWDGPDHWPRNNGLHLRAVRDVLVSNVTFRNYTLGPAPTSFLAAASANGLVDNVWFRNCAFEEGPTAGVFIDGGHGVGVIDSTFAGFQSGGITMFTNNDLTDDFNANGRIDPPEQRNTRYAIVHGNTIAHNNAHAILVQGERSLIRRNTTTGFHQALAVVQARTADTHPEVVYANLGIKIMDNTVQQAFYVAQFLAIPDGCYGRAGAPHACKQLGQWTVTGNQVVNPQRFVDVVDIQPANWPTEGPLVVANNTVGGTR